MGRFDVLTCHFIKQQSHPDLIRDALKKDKAARKARKKKGGAADEPSAGETDNED